MIYMPREEFISTVRCEGAGRRPTYLFDVTLGMDIAGYDTNELFMNGLDGEKSARSLLALQRYTGMDAVNGSVVWIDTRELGNKVEFPPHGIMYTTKHVLADDPDLIYRKKKFNVSDESIRQVILSHKIVHENTDAALIQHIPSPVTVAASMRGFEQFLMDTLSEPDYVDDLLKFTSRVDWHVADAVMKEILPDMCLISGAYDNIDVVGTDIFERISMPTMEWLIKRLHRFDTRICFHPHGKLSESGTAQRAIRNLKLDCLYYGEYNDPVVLRKKFPKFSLMGGIDTFTTIALGDMNRVIDDTNALLDSTSEIDNMIFTCSCSVDRGLSHEKIKTMVDTVKAYDSRLVLPKP